MIRGIGIVLLILAPISCFALMSSDDGGMSGGGGFILAGRPADKVADLEKVEEQVKSFHMVAVHYLKDLKGEWLNGKRDASLEPLLKKAFAGSHDILFFAKSIKPTVLESSSCFDFYGNAVDGSVLMADSIGICISARNIAEKVHSSEIEAQSVALMIHEYSEVAGFTETEAIALQEMVYLDLLGE